MPILLPLALIGVGYLLYLIFAGATLALPIAAGLLAGFGAGALGLAPFAAFALGFAVFIAVIALGRFAALALPSRGARATIAALFAVPAGIVGYSAARAVDLFGGLAGNGAALAAAFACAVVAVHRLVRPA